MSLLLDVCICRRSRSVRPSTCCKSRRHSFCNPFSSSILRIDPVRFLLEQPIFSFAMLRYLSADLQIFHIASSSLHKTISERPSSTGGSFSRLLNPSSILFASEMGQTSGCGSNGESNDDLPSILECAFGTRRNERLSFRVLT